MLNWEYFSLAEDISLIRCKPGRGCASQERVGSYIKEKSAGFEFPLTHSVLDDKC